MRMFKQPWYPGETISVAIGQGAVSVTPIAMATMISTVANGGTLVTPHLVRAVDPDGKGWQQLPLAAPREQTVLSGDNLQAVRDGLWLVVNGAGTGRAAMIDGKDVSGKTGTAQVLSLTGAKAAAGKMDVRDHGWFVFFAPRDNPQIAGIVFAEHGTARLIGDAHRAIRARDVLREEGGQADAAAAGVAACRSDSGRPMIDDRRLSAHLDWPLLSAVVVLALVGLATIYSVTWDFKHNQPGPQFWTQLYALASRPGRARRRAGDRLPDARAALADVLRHPGGRPDLRGDPRRHAHGRAALDDHLEVFAAALGVRPASSWRWSSR